MMLLTEGSKLPQLYTSRIRHSGEVVFDPVSRGVRSMSIEALA